MARLVALTTLLVALLAPGAQAADLAATQRVLAREMARSGAYSGAYVVDVNRNQELFAYRPDTARVPASVEKLYTSASALLNYGPEARLTTSVLAETLPDETGTIAGDIVLRGGGDPTFGPVQAAALADQLVDAGLTRIEGRVIGDESAFDAFRGPLTARLEYWVGPLSALSFNHGRTGKRRPYFQTSPARFAAQAFEKALKQRGVRIARKARAGAAAEGMTPYSEWRSPTMASIVRRMNQPSDNYIAEMLVKALGADHGSAGSTAAGAGVMRETLQRFSIAPRIVDGSGLSRSNHTTPRQVVQLLTGMDASEVADAFERSLAVAGRNGTLSKRMRRTPAQGRCRAKTGTLSNVSALAGFCDTTGGERVAFAFLMNGVWPGSARALQDRMTVALARYDA